MTGKPEDTKDLTWDEYEDKIVEVISVGLAKALERPDGPFQGAADIQEVDDFRVIITGTLHFGVLAQEVLSVALWLYNDHPEYLHFLRGHLKEAQEELQRTDHD